MDALCVQRLGYPGVFEIDCMHNEQAKNISHDYRILSLITYISILYKQEYQGNWPH
jgi:hypothetical protein